MEGSGEKRRRQEKDGDEKGKKKKKTTVSKEVERPEEIAATEEEVEEFIAILERMQAAAKYFGEGWRTVIESEVVAVDAAAEVVEKDNINGGDDDQGNDKGGMVMRKQGPSVVEVEEDQNGVLDLNCVPEGDSYIAL